MSQFFDAANGSGMKRGLLGFEAVTLQALKAGHIKRPRMRPEVPMAPATTKLIHNKVAELSAVDTNSSLIHTRTIVDASWYPTKCPVVPMLGVSVSQLRCVFPKDSSLLFCCIPWQQHCPNLPKTRTPLPPSLPESTV